MQIDWRIVLLDLNKFYSLNSIYIYIYCCSAKNLTFQFTKIQLKKLLQTIFLFHIYYSLGLVETFKTRFKNLTSLSGVKWPLN